MIPKSHPRYASLMTRDKIVSGVDRGITSTHGLIAHGRGEAFDYLLGEKTNKFALESIDAAARLLLRARHPVISVNGNVAALCPKEIAQLSEAIPAQVEVNIFHASKEREGRIKEWLKANGAREVLVPGKGIIPTIDHNRRYTNENGILIADVVFVPLEDGDRCEALIKMGKKVITVDLNPLSRTARASTITIVDNIIRAMPLLIRRVKQLKGKKAKKVRYNNKKVLKKSLKYIAKRFS
ncbi:MAG TPA: 4-phosphopantoate--beta-alanine ligase [Candidatus Nanoarchaeia archaeon]|nr:4-phosphopantoate--beta-alanine ligase [Candidatus Nanoarchaeia archaeon]